MKFSEGLNLHLARTSNQPIILYNHSPHLLDRELCVHKISPLNVPPYIGNIDLSSHHKGTCQIAWEKTAKKSNSLTATVLESRNSQPVARICLDQLTIPREGIGESLIQPGTRKSTRDKKTPLTWEQKGIVSSFFRPSWR